MRYKLLEVMLSDLSDLHHYRKKTVEVSPPGKIAAGTTEIPFFVPLRERGDGDMEKFYETFHGADINIQYLATVGIMRGYLHKSLHATTEFIIETDKAELFDPPLSPETVIFYITQDTQKHPLLPELRSGQSELFKAFTYFCFCPPYFCSAYDFVNMKS
uniref:Uncharacterized protein n=1 Tax=Kalanchoe fedtschenkoi TaxID=63787 RepID=A0A7N1A8H2_KALFE